MDLLQYVSYYLLLSNYYGHLVISWCGWRVRARVRKQSIVVKLGSQLLLLAIRVGQQHNNITFPCSDCFNSKWCRHSDFISIGLHACNI